MHCSEGCKGRGNNDDYKRGGINLKGLISNLPIRPFA